MSAVFLLSLCSEGGSSEDLIAMVFHRGHSSGLGQLMVLNGQGLGSNT